MIEDRVELNDLNKYKNDMMVTLADFKEQRKTFLSMSISEVETNNENVKFVKFKVGKLRDEIDLITDVQVKQSQMIGYLVNAIAKKHIQSGNSSDFPDLLNHDSLKLQ